MTARNRSRRTAKANYRILNADCADAREICTVLRRSIADVCGPDYGNDESILEAWLANKIPANVVRWTADAGNRAFVAGGGAEIVGFALRRNDEILLNYVAPEHIGKGAGHLLMEAMERSAQVEGLTELHCLGTITARAFYERHGFEPAGNPNHVGGIPGEFPLRKRIGPIGG